MRKGTYRVKADRIDEFNSKFRDYGDELKGLTFNLKDKKEHDDSLVYRFEFHNQDHSFQDAITKNITKNNAEWFESFFISMD